MALSITANREILADAFRSVAMIAPTRSPKEVLNNVKLTCNGSAKLTATDLETWISVELNEDAIDYSEDGQCLLNTSRTGAILKECSDDQLTLSLDDSTLVLTTDSSEFRLPTTDADEFPSTNEFPKEDWFGFEARAIKEAIARTAFCTDESSTRFVLGGILIEHDGDKMIFVGTDGRRLATCEAKVKVQGSPTTSQTIIPTKAIQAVGRLLPDDETPVYLAVSNNDIAVKCEGTYMRTRLIEGRYPNWRKVLPDTDEWTIETDIPSTALASRIRLAAIVADKESRGIDFVFKPGSLRLAATTADVGQSNIQLPVESDAEAKVKLDHRFVTEFLYNVPESVTFRCAGEAHPCLLTYGDYRYVLMPMAAD